MPPARHEASQDEPDGIEASLVLFRDLDEVLYVAGGPVVEELPEAELEFDSELPPQWPRKSRSLSKAVDERDRRDCKAIAQGHTFTTSIDRDLMKIVIRGRQLSLTIFDVIPQAENSRLALRAEAGKDARLDRRGHPTCKCPRPGARQRHDNPA